MDLVVEDTQAEEVERVRARKEGGAAWNETESKHYVYVAYSIICSYLDANNLAQSYLSWR